MFEKYINNKRLTNLLDSKDLLINENGEIKDLNGNNIPYELDPEGNKIVTIDSWDGYRSYRVIDLMVFQFKNIKIPLKHYKRVSGFVLDGNKDNLHASNIGYRFLDGPIELDELPGFYYIPGATLYAINKKGILYSIKTKTYKSWYITQPQVKNNIKGGYWVSVVVFDKGSTFNISRHRSLCLVFKPYPDNVENLVVNHIDGVPGNDDLDNLEWITRSENNIHAYQNNLKGQQMPVLTRHVITGEITEYYSISEAARQMGYATDETIRQRIVSSEFGKVFSDGTQIKLKNDKRDWLIPDDPEAALAKASDFIGTKITSRNCLTLEVREHDNILEASRFTDVNTATIRFRIGKNDKSPLFGYQFKRTDDKEPFPSFTSEDLVNSLTPSSFKVNGRNILTGELRDFDSAATASLFVGNTSAAAKLREGSQPLQPSGWQLKYEDDDWEHIEDPVNTTYELNKKVMARNETTGQLVFASSAREMGRTLNLDSKALRKHALTRGKSLYHGYRFRLGHTGEPWPVCQ